MPAILLGKGTAFPDPRTAQPSGGVAVGGDLAPERLLAAYARGIFPWPSEGLPLLWHSPPQRFLLEPRQVVVNRTLAKVLRRKPFEVRMDTAFSSVILACSRTPRPGQDGTWLTPEMRLAYTELHRLGWAHSVEAWQDGALVGGLYGVAIGAAFCGESMFADVADASKVALVTLCAQLARWRFPLLDAQVHTEHLQRLGARLVPREEFLRQLAAATAVPNPPGPWRIDADFERGARPE